MNLIYKSSRRVFSVLIALLLSANAQADQSTDKLVEYLKNLGGYMGYKIQQGPPDDAKATLTNFDITQRLQTFSLTTLMGALPVNAISSAFSLFVPSSSDYSAFNAYANFIFEQSGGSQDDQVFISKLIDQKNYQKDPVSQSVLNLLATPDFSYCVSNDGKKIDSNTFDN